MAGPSPTGTTPAQPASVRELDTLVRARYPLLCLVSFEEARLGRQEILRRERERLGDTWSERAPRWWRALISHP